MNATLSGLIDTLAGRRILVLGEAMLDSYLEGHAGRFCPEAPAPIVTLSRRHDLPGGAANTAVNAQSLGGEATFLSVVGPDGEGQILRQALAERGLSLEHLLIDPTRRTLLKQRVAAGSQLLLRLDQGSTQALEPKMEEELIQRLTTLYPQCEAVIVADYCYGVITPRVLRVLADLQAQLVARPGRRFSPPGRFPQSERHRHQAQLRGGGFPPGRTGSRQPAKPCGNIGTLRRTDSGAEWGPDGGHHPG